VTDVVVK